MIKRFFDIIFSGIGILFLLPIFFILAILVKLESKGPIIFKQIRVGKNNVDFKLFKFRSMYLDAEKRGQLTVGMKDPRITKMGYFLRKYKLDELPQLFNVFIGDMSLVGPRPEVRKYVDYYTPEQKKVLTVRPGITDYASIKFINENELLAKAENPEAFYITDIMPQKLKLNLQYIENPSLFKDIQLIVTTLLKIIT
ncbi:MAG: sugar transferase [Bacteroidia bacterium]|nr:sugar transferase [Bacteroidia bacterium]MCZ2140162.1 sugar transferase [Bacteroidia bacterium]